MSCRHLHWEHSNIIPSLEDVERELRNDPAYQNEERRIAPYFQIARQIIARRIELGLTQADLAEKAATHQSRISKIESGDHDIRISTLVKIAEALGVSVHVLLGEQAEYQPIAVQDSHGYVMSTAISHTSMAGHLLREKPDPTTSSGTPDK